MSSHTFYRKIVTIGTTFPAVVDAQVIEDNAGRSLMRNPALGIDCQVSFTEENGHVESFKAKYFYQNDKLWVNLKDAPDGNEDAKYPLESIFVKGTTEQIKEVKKKLHDTLSAMIEKENKTLKHIMEEMEKQPQTVLVGCASAKDVEKPEFSSFLKTSSIQLKERGGFRCFIETKVTYPVDEVRHYSFYKFDVDGHFSKGRCIVNTVYSNSISRNKITEVFARNSTFSPCENLYNDLVESIQLEVLRAVDDWMNWHE